MTRQFERTIEDFECEECGARVKGDGFTNHCPKCLFSKHVDENPGDRSNRCLGLMEPISVTMKRGNYIIIHRCRACGTEKPNRASSDDDFETILKVAKAASDRV